MRRLDILLVILVLIYCVKVSVKNIKTYVAHRTEQQSQIRTHLDKLGYSRIKYITNRMPMLSDQKFSCQWFYEKSWTATYRYYAQKNGILRLITACINNKKSLKVYDSQELPEFPLMVDSDQARSVYLKVDNLKAIELLDHLE